MKLRPANPGDVRGITALVKRAYAVYVERIGREPAPMVVDYRSKLGEAAVVVAEEEGRVVGVIVLLQEPDHLLVENVAVDPSWQGTGVGRALMAHAERQASELRLPELRLYTNAAMYENFRFYSDLGYVVVDRRVEEGFNRVFFTKRVSSDT